MNTSNSPSNNAAALPVGITASGGALDASDQTDCYWIQQALELAKAAGEAGEVPVGAIVVDGQNRCLARGANRRERDHDPTAHAEIVALRRAGAARQNWYLDDCSLYVTLEPCPMCAGSLLQARLRSVIYGTPDPKAGAVQTVIKIPQGPAALHKLQVRSGVLQDQCRDLLQTWFRDRRQSRKQSKSIPKPHPI
ncbi:MAG: tRNA adenosine(34) deaminase TadA [Cyanobacteria bacterium P01_H01_bin.121]